MPVNPAPAEITPVALLCPQWFQDTTSLDVSVVPVVFHDLIAQHFTNQQAVPTTEWNRLLTGVLPALLLC